MKRVSIGEFEAHAGEYVARAEKLEIERDGRTVGYYVPVAAKPRDIPTERRAKPEAREAMEHLERTVQRVLDETGLTEDELADLFDLNKPFPDGPIGRAKKPV